MGDMFATSVSAGLIPPQSSQGPKENLSGAARGDRLSRVFETSAKPVVLPVSAALRSEASVEKTEENVYHVEGVIEAGLDSEEEFAETPDPEEQEEKEELNESSPDNKPAMEAGDFSDEEEKEKNSEEKTAEKIRRKESKALQKAKAILLQNY